VNRDADGNEALSGLASSGNLPSVSSLYPSASTIHYHAGGIENARSVVKDAEKARNAKKNDGRVASVTLEEYQQKFDSLNKGMDIEINSNGDVLSKNEFQQKKRLLKLQSAEVLIVTVSPKNSAELDSAVTAAVESDKFSSVLLAGIRSTNEIKTERIVAENTRRNLMVVKKSPSRRRLEDAADDGDDDGNNADYSTYYVNMTPNIFAGVLYMFLFIYIAWTGIQCMAQIEGQDVYVSKMPAVGREA